MKYYDENRLHATDYDTNEEVSICKVYLENERDHEKYNVDEDANEEGFLIEITKPYYTNYDCTIKTEENYFTEEELLTIIDLGVRALKARKQEAYDWEQEQEIEALKQLNEERAGKVYFYR